MSDREKDVEILALHHQIAVLERQLNGQQVRFHASDRAFLASLLHGVPLQNGFTAHELGVCRVISWLGGTR